MYNGLHVHYTSNLKGYKVEKDYIIARVKDASGENFDKFEHTIIGLYNSEDNISNAFDKWLNEHNATISINHRFFLEVLDINLNEYADLSSRAKGVWRRIKEYKK